MSGVKVKVTLQTIEAGSRPDETKTTTTTWANVARELTAAEVAALIRNAVESIDPQGVLELGGGPEAA